MPDGGETKYETHTFHSMRGMESRAIKKWMDDGWEVVSETPGKLRTEITIRRVKQPARTLPWIIGGVVLVIAIATAITIGTISERNAAAELGDPMPVATAGTNATPTANPRPDPTVDAVCDPTSGSGECDFGQTAAYSDGDVQLEITVQEPVEFSPSGDAIFFDNFANEWPAQPVNVYFPVTIKNISPATARESDFVFTQATNSEQGESDVYSADDGDVVSGVRFQSLAPGDSYSFKDGWSMSTLDGAEWTISIDGLAGYSITFAR